MLEIRNPVFVIDLSWPIMLSFLSSIVVYLILLWLHSSCFVLTLFKLFYFLHLSLLVKSVLTAHESTLYFVGDASTEMVYSILPAEAKESNACIWCCTPVVSVAIIALLVYLCLCTQKKEYIDAFEILFMFMSLALWNKLK